MHSREFGNPNESQYQHCQKHVFSDISTPTENDLFFTLLSVTYRSSVRAQKLGRTPAFADPNIYKLENQSQTADIAALIPREGSSSVRPFNTDTTSVKHPRTAAPSQPARRPTITSRHTCFKEIMSNFVPFPEPPCDSHANSNRILAGTETERIIITILHHEHCATRPGDLRLPQWIFDDPFFLGNTKGCIQRTIQSAA